jgi:hypothetical protein
MTQLSYKCSKDNSKLFLFCSKEKYQSVFKSLNGEWKIYDNKDQFVLPIKEKEEMDKILSSMDEKSNKSTSTTYKYRNPMDKHVFYKTFASKPANFQKILRKKSSSYSSTDELSLSSSSCGSSSSSDDFPSPGTPHRTYTEDEIYEAIDLVNVKIPELEHIVKKLEKKVRELSTLVSNQK